MRLNWNCLGTWMLLWQRKGEAFTLGTEFPQLNMVVGASCCGACFAASVTGSLVRVHGIMKKEIYVDILRENMQKSDRSLGLGHRWVFQQDNDPKHTLKLVQQFLKDTKTKILEWPSQSSDLNPIENLWQVLKVNVHAQKPRILDQLEQFEMEEWAKIPQETCANNFNI